MKHPPTAEEANRLYNLAANAARVDAQRAADNAIEFAVLLEQNIQAGGDPREWLGWFHRDGAAALDRIDQTLRAFQELRTFFKTLKDNTPPGKPKNQTAPDTFNDEQFDDDK